MKMKNIRSALASAISSLALAFGSAHAAPDEYDKLMDAKNFQEAERAIAKKLATAPDDPDALATKADLLLMSGNEKQFEDAVKIAERCIATNPNNSKCHGSLGISLGAIAQRGNMLFAVRHIGTIFSSFEKAVALDPKNYRALFFLMQVYLEVPSALGGSERKAEELIAATSTTEPGASALLRAKLFLYKRNYANASAAALSAETNKTRALLIEQKNLLASIGFTLIREKKYSQAQSIFSETIRRHPDFARGYLGIGIAELESNKPQNAVASLEKSLALDPSASALYRMAKTQQALGDRAAAISFYERAVRFKPGLNKTDKSDAENQLASLR
jgi:tetratricopeptide (TPR) repeat protein